MSRLLEELKGQTVTVTVNGFGTKYEIMDIDEDWVKLTRVNNKQQSRDKTSSHRRYSRYSTIMGAESHDLKNRLKELRARDGLNQPS